MHVSSSYSNVLGETNFYTWEIPRVGQKQKTEKKKEEEEERERERLNDGNNNGQATHGACKSPGQIIILF